jgi:hypothetical protein
VYKLKNVRNGRWHDCSHDGLGWWFHLVGSREVDKGHEGPKIHGNVYGLCKRDFQPIYEKGLFQLVHTILNFY